MALKSRNAVHRESVCVNASCVHTTQSGERWAVVALVACKREGGSGPQLPAVQQGWAMIFIWFSGQ